MEEVTNIFLVDVGPNNPRRTADLVASVSALFGKKKQYIDPVLDILFFVANCELRDAECKNGEAYFLLFCMPEIIMRLVALQQDGINLLKNVEDLDKAYPILYACIKKKNKKALKMYCYHLILGISQQLQELFASEYWKYCPPSLRNRIYDTDDLLKQLAEQSADKKNRAQGVFAHRFTTPEAVKEYLDEYVYKQDTAKWYAAQFFFEKVRHYDRNDSILQSDMLLIGPTGCGKTYIWECLSKISPVPIAIVDATDFTTQGFKGGDKEEILLDLLDRYPGLEHGFIVMDEFDKRCGALHDKNGDDINKQIQSGLLKTIEGYTVAQGGKRIDTTDITFVCAGAFTGIYEKLQAKVYPIGFSAHMVQGVQNANEDIMKLLIDYGMMSEMAGRLSRNVVVLSTLTEDDYYHILTKTKENVISYISSVFKEYYDITVKFTDKALRAAAKLACEHDIGARGVAGVVERACRTHLESVRKQKRHTFEVTPEIIMSSRVVLLENEKEERHENERTHKKEACKKLER